jgi:hypothetical protein
MRTTVDLPDELLRQAKARAALEGMKLKDLIAHYIARGLAGSTRSSEATAQPAKPPPSLHDIMKDCCGIAAETPTDYSTNPAHLEGFGR